MANSDLISRKRLHLQKGGTSPAQGRSVAIFDPRPRTRRSPCPACFELMDMGIGNVTGEDLAIDATWPPAFSSVADTDVLIAGLPSKSHCKELVQIYLTSFASLFHVLHDPSFQSQYQSFEGDPNSVPLSWLALLYTTLATAVLALPHDSYILVDLSRKQTAFERIADLTARYRGLAMKCLEADNYLWNNNLTTVQALVILIYSISHTHGPTWSLIGLACNIAVSIGCHVDPDAFVVDNVEKEQRRRCWAALMMLYTQQNATMGNIASSRFMFQSDARAPADVDDRDIALNTTSRDRPTQMTYLLAKFRLYDLCAEICESVLSTQQPDIYVIPSLDARIQTEQRGWHARYMESGTSDEMPAYHYAHLNILYSYSGHLALLLHQHAMSDNRVGDGSIRWSRERSLQEAKRILAIHQEFESCPRLAPFKWYNRGLGSFHAFHAAVLMIASLRVSLSEQETAEQHELLQRSLACFQVMSELSPLCARAHPILCRLYARAQAETTPLITPPLSAGLIDDLSNEFDWDALSSQIQPQQWLTPSNMPWEQLNTLVMV
ncbi:hypothetical protein B0A48_02492 [Cryoendolithus antarcticus]|uniref:Xylanolytic transcriptional activator regulatory domain-containing protein n=1 Tax=Cryoendolithus antarcticus TaxID=1507870 RepID=A0A1V8TP41_9PEZI|nr:hypothetical protein B0A48_02492 [Cryoendolithus antarcticus]